MNSLAISATAVPAIIAFLSLIHRMLPEKARQSAFYAWIQPLLPVVLGAAAAFLTPLDDIAGGTAKIMLGMGWGAAAGQAVNFTNQSIRRKDDRLAPADATPAKPDEALSKPEEPTLP